jgi:hypothetical protein
MRSTRYVVLLSGFLWGELGINSHLCAKGLENITPEAPEPPSAAAPPTSPSGAEVPKEAGDGAVKEQQAAPQQTQKPAQAEVPGQGGEGEKAVAPQEGEAEKVAAPVVQRSKVSEKLDGKLFLSTNLGFLLPGAQRSSGGKWHARSAGGVGGGYQIVDTVAWLRGSPLFLTFDYLALAAAAEVKGHSYWTSSQFYSAGVMSPLPLRDNLQAVAQISGVLASTSLKPTDGLPAQHSLKNLEYGLALMGGVDWKIADKLSIGPRYQLFVGGYQLGYLSFGGSFYF